MAPKADRGAGWTAQKGERVVSRLGDLRLTIYQVTNLDEVGGNCYLRYAALFEKPER